MKLRIVTSTFAALTVTTFTVAQTPKTDEDHSAHHPPGSATAPTAVSPMAPEAIDKQIKAMQDMHLRMQSAKTPAERAALMDEHMKLMQSGMSMMGQMQGMGGSGAMGRSGNSGGMGMMPPQAQASGAGPAASGMAGRMGMHQQMDKRMAMMEQMMQMMVDREAAKPRQ